MQQDTPRPTSRPQNDAVHVAHRSVVKKSAMLLERHTTEHTSQIQCAAV
jgi:hypothetical protein